MYGDLSNLRPVPLPVTEGGTGLTSVSAGQVLYATGANTLAAGTPDATGLVDKRSTQTGIAGDKTFVGNLNVTGTFFPQITVTGTFLPAINIVGVGTAAFLNLEGSLGSDIQLIFNTSAPSSSRGWGISNRNTAGTLKFSVLGDDAGGVLSTPLQITTAGAATFSGSVAAASAAVAGNVALSNGGVLSFANTGHASSFTPSVNSYLNCYSYNGHAFQTNAGTVAAFGNSASVAATFFGSVAIGNGTACQQILSATATLDFGSTAAQSSADLTVTVTGAAVGDVVSLGLPAAPAANTSFTAWVSAANVVTIRHNNYSTGAVDPTSGTYRVAVLKF